MRTECNQLSFNFHPLGGRQVSAAFNGGTITSDGGALLLRELEVQTGLLASLAQCFDDHRDPELVEHTVEELLKQRVFALALGYEDLNDHDALRTDPLLATLVGKRGTRWVRIVSIQATAARPGLASAHSIGWS